MNNKDKKRHFAYEALLLLCCMAVLFFITRLWPLIFLAILGIFVAIIRLLFLSARKVEAIAPQPIPRAEPKKPTYANVRDMAFGLIQMRITELLAIEHPDARWVWENSRPRDDVMAGRPVYILLNRAGGYRRALVSIRNLQVCDIVFEMARPAQEHLNQDDDNSENALEDLSGIPEKESDEEMEINYGLIAFEWVEAHVLELNGRLNEAIAQGEAEFLIPAADLPEKDSWPDICQELVRNGLEEPECSDTGILIQCKQ